MDATLGTKVKDRRLQDMIDRAMARCDADIENARLVAEGRERAREARRDELVARGLARAARGRFYKRMFE